MSKTDKTRPPWVQAADPHNRGWQEVWHDHRHGAFRRPLDVCDIESAHPSDGWRGRRCCFWPSRIAARSGVYRPSTATLAVYRNKANGRSRGEWRRVARELLKSDRAAVYDSEYAATQHRHGAKWDAW